MDIKPYNENSFYGSIRSKGYSKLFMSGYLYNFVFDFAPWIGTDEAGRNEFSRSKYLSTTVESEGAAYFYLAAVKVLRDPDSTEPMVATYPCKSGASITFSYVPDENGHMDAYLEINKDGRTIPFKFDTLTKNVRVNGQIVTKSVQADLAIFAMTLFGYIIWRRSGMDIPGEQYLKKVFEEGINP